MPKRSPLKLRRYQFTLAGKRRNVSLGQLPDYLFTEYAKHLDDLVIAKRLATLPTESTNRWLADIADGLHAKIAAVGLCEGRGDTLLGALLDGYIEQNGGGKEQGTLDRWRDDKNRLLEFFGAERNVKSIRQYDCEGYKQHLYNVKEYAHSTIGKALRNAKQFFAWFVRRGVISQNPFAEVKGSDATIEERTQYVSRETVESVMEYCPDAEWRAVFALARYAGLRPGEIQILKLDDIKWERNRIVVRSPKTKRHVGGGQRETPIFPELLPYLLEVCEQADSEAVYVLERLRLRSAGAQCGKKINLGKILCDILEKAGIPKWGKPFVSLRSSCETDLAEIYPLHVVTSWLGNSPRVAQKHYLKVLPEHFEKASEVGFGLGRQKTDVKFGAKSGAVGAKNGATGEKMGATSARGTTENPKNQALCASEHNEPHPANPPDYPARSRTLYEGTKIPCVTNYTTGQWNRR